MALPHVRVPAYLSPTSLRMLEEHPLEFYFRRLGPPEFAPPKPQQTFPMATGIVFDVCVKNMVAKMVGLTYEPETGPDVDAERRDEAAVLGAELTARYAESGAFDTFLLDQPTAVSLQVDGLLEDVPLRGYIDALFKNHVIHDWKLSGSNKPGTRSPKPGYSRLFDSRTRSDAGPHARAGAPLEALCPEWADQLAFYALILDVPSPPRVSIDEVVVEEENHVRVAQYRTTISPAYVEGMKQRIIEAWDRILSERVVPPEVADMGIEAAKAMR